jgi:uncharacterized protein (TIGR02246 family)
MTSEDDITQLLHTYERSLNDSDAALAASCYASDGVFLPTNLPTATAGGLLKAYEQTFSVIDLDVTFTIDELVIAGDDIAYALTRSNGIQTLLATDTRTAESNREVFIFRNEGGVWKIARYMFNKPE